MYCEDGEKHRPDTCAARHTEICTKAGGEGCDITIHTKLFKVRDGHRQGTDRALGDERYDTCL